METGLSLLQELNPRFIYVWGGGFGYGPKIFGGSYDILGQAHAGLSSVTGTHEDFGGHSTKHQLGHRLVLRHPDHLRHPGGPASGGHKTGLGTMIEFSQVQAATRCLGHTAPLYGRFGIVRQRWGNWDTQLCVHGIIMAGKSDFPDAVNPQDKFEARYVMAQRLPGCGLQGPVRHHQETRHVQQVQNHKERVGAQAQVEIYKAIGGLGGG